ncbi:hypothetical protein BJ912DRAFT_649176 [Pholiota molesta]|nr:hypothetical protein BJ912DRAFT_649176 [Pholiota molesta]
MDSRLIYVLLMQCFLRSGLCSLSGSAVLRKSQKMYPMQRSRCHCQRSEAFNHFLGINGIMLGSSSSQANTQYLKTPSSWTRSLFVIL